MESWSLCIALDVLDGSIRPSWEIRIMNDGILKLSSNKWVEVFPITFYFKQDTSNDNTC